ncbi:MAG TPA: hypothetical protein VFZ09_42725 [Archangium sp.]|uniref:hypothetical protein n=1 Tax=Archangium sp. TaxID=1872627 RepID=UPI002E34790A|nr:hypothetical protein [Archangium sp.]HEX5752994.1 hypothetical protein [Archangium sp.]
MAGCPTVLIGSSVQSNVIQLAARDGTPFCEECEKKRIVRMYWTYGKEEIPLTDQSRFYVDMNLHIETENYAPGESVAVTISRDDGSGISEGVQELSFTAIVKEGGEAKIEDIFNNSRVDIVMKD